MNAVCALRKKKGFTQIELAKVLCVHQTTISLWETGQTMPTADKLPLLAKALGCTIDELFADATKKQA